MVRRHADISGDWFRVICGKRSLAIHRIHRKMKMRPRMIFARSAGNQTSVSHKTDCLTLLNHSAAGSNRNTPRNHVRIPTYYSIAMIDDQLRAISSIVSFLTNKHRLPGCSGNHSFSVCLAPDLRKIQRIPIFFDVRRRSAISLRHDKALSSRIG